MHKFTQKPLKKPNVIAKTFPSFTSRQLCIGVGAVGLCEIGSRIYSGGYWQILAGLLEQGVRCRPPDATNGQLQKKKIVFHQQGELVLLLFFLDDIFRFQRRTPAVLPPRRCWEKKIKKHSCRSPLSCASIHNSPVMFEQSQTSRDPRMKAGKKLLL